MSGQVDFGLHRLANVSARVSPLLRNGQLLDAFPELRINMPRLHEDEPTTHDAVVALTITPAARVARRLAGPIAWSILEDVVADARLHAGQLTATTNVRTIANHLDVSKDTAARGLRRLATLGLVARSQPTRVAGGTFGPTSYVLTLTELVGVVVSTEEPRSRLKRSSGMQEQSLPEQAALFDLDGCG